MKVVKYTKVVLFKWYSEERTKLTVKVLPYLFKQKWHEGLKIEIEDSKYYLQFAFKKYTILILNGPEKNNAKNTGKNLQ